MTKWAGIKVWQLNMHKRHNIWYIIYGSFLQDDNHLEQCEKPS